MHTFTIAPAETDDLADVAALFRAYAAVLDIDLGVQGFEQEWRNCLVHTRRRKARCCWRAAGTVLRSAASLSARSMRARVK